MESDREILEKHLNELKETSKDGDITVHALRRMLELTDNTIWVNTKRDLMITVDAGQLEVYQNGKRIERIQELQFNYNKEEFCKLEIKQNI